MAPAGYETPLLSVRARVAEIAEVELRADSKLDAINAAQRALTEKLSDLTNRFTVRWLDFRGGHVR
jgi:hypothetical protein